MFKSDIEIAQESKMENIKNIAEKIGLTEEDIDLYGKYKCKISLDVLKRNKDKKDGKLILVTAINPTPAGEGKSTVTVGLGQALWKKNKKSSYSIKRTFFRTCIWYKRRCSWRWILSSCTYGRYKSSFYRGYACYYFSQ